MARNEPEDEDAETEDESEQNQYGGDSGDVDATEQTERMTEEDG